MPVTESTLDIEFHMGDRLRKARENTGDDAKAFASKLGISRDSLRSYERGDTTPRRPVLAAWAVATGYPVEWLETGCPPWDSNPEPAGYVRDAQIVTLPLTQRPVADFVADAA